MPKHLSWLSVSPHSYSVTSATSSPASLISTGKGLPSGGIHTPSIRDLPCLYAENRGRTVLSALFVNVNTYLPGFGIVKRRCRRLDNLFKLSLSLSSFLVAQTVRGRAALSAKEV